MLNPKRVDNKVNSYRYGHNGMEMDNEVSGKGNSYTSYFRQYDPRLGRWKSLDPVTHPWQSPYNAFDSNPIFWSDPSGADAQEGDDDDPKKPDGEIDKEDEDGFVLEDDDLSTDTEIKPIPIEVEPTPAPELATRGESSEEDIPRENNGMFSEVFQYTSQGFNRVNPVSSQNGFITVNFNGSNTTRVNILPPTPLSLALERNGQNVGVYFGRNTNIQFFVLESITTVRGDFPNGGSNSSYLVTFIDNTTGNVINVVRSEDLSNLTIQQDQQNVITATTAPINSPLSSYPRTSGSNNTYTRHVIYPRNGGLPPNYIPVNGLQGLQNISIRVDAIFNNWQIDNTSSALIDGCRGAQVKVRLLY